jgi:aspartate/methionine/tyrosine aminotransferase
MNKISPQVLVVDLDAAQFRLHRHLDTLLFDSGINFALDLSHGTNRLAAPRAFSEQLIAGLSDRQSVSEYSSPLGPPELRDAIAQSESLRSDQRLGLSDVVITNGASEALLLSAMYLKSACADTALLIGPQFPTLFSSMEAAGVSVRMALGRRSDGYEIDAHAAIEAVRKARPGVVVMSQPANPGGTVFSAAELDSLLRSVADVRAALVYDRLQADIPSQWWAAPPSVVRGAAHYGLDLYLIDSWSKRRSIPGLRLGYLIAPPSAVRWIGEAVSGGTVSTLATHAAILDLASTDHQWKEYRVTGSPAEQDYVAQVHDAHRICSENLAFALNALRPWLLSSSRHKSGMNFWVELSLPRPSSELDVAVSLATRYSLGCYPVSCFLVGDGCAKTSSVFLRVTASSPTAEFTATVAMLTAALSDDLSTGSTPSSPLCV